MENHVDRATILATLSSYSSAWRSSRAPQTRGIIEACVTARTAKVYALRLIVCGCLALGEASLCAGDQPSDEEQPMSEMPAISIESDQPTASPTLEQLRRNLHSALKQRPSTPEERRLADGTLEITTQLGHFCAKPLPLQPQSGVGGNTRLAAPCATF
jgi:hypothetical protein